MGFFAFKKKFFSHVGFMYCNKASNLHRYNKVQTAVIFIQISRV